MPFFHWIDPNWFEFLQSIFIVAGFAVTCITLERDLRSRRVENRFSITHSHREIWSLLYDRPELGRILDQDVDLEESPITDSEAVFLTLLFLHLWSTIEAVGEGLPCTVVYHLRTHFTFGEVNARLASN